ncbi:MAG: ribonuclease III [Melioribacteraceae bacterium]|nr:ribonuclease III [Melioribacteraceae bacterium]
MLNKLFSLFRKKKSNSLLGFDNKQKKRVLKKIEEFVKLSPKDETYYIKAFTHRSYLDQSKEGIKSNERLEFLGDSILSKIVADYLFNEYPNKKEGFLTKARSHLVNKHSLEKIGFDLKLNELLFINDKYLMNDKKNISNIVADCLEALIAAIYLDLGEDAAKNFVHKYIIKPQVISGRVNYDKNYKGQLLEFAHANKLNQPIYKILEQTGPQHDKIYKIEVFIDENISGVGVGPNKKIAEQKAAKFALKNAKSILQNLT